MRSPMPVRAASSRRGSDSRKEVGMRLRKEEWTEEPRGEGVTRTVGLAAAVAFADFHRSPADAADAEI